MRRSLVSLLVTLVVGTAGALVPAGGAGATTPHRASFTQIENDLMCIVCHESLAVAQAPEAYSERQYIRTLIAQGLTKKQIENDMVQQYGTAVLAVPPAKGFSLIVYILPPVLLAMAIGGLAIALPRWRRRSRRNAAAAPSPALTLAPADAQRLADDLARDA